MITLWALLTTAAAFAFDVDLRPILGPVENQGLTRNSCATFAVGAMAEAVVAQSTGQRLTFSKEHIGYLGRTLGASEGRLAAMYEGVDGMAAFMAARGLVGGVALESAWPYDPQGLPSPLSMPPPELAASPYRFELEFIERDQIGNWMLQNQRPVAVNLKWYSSLFDRSGRLTRLPTDLEKNLCHREGRGCGGHVVLLVGFDPIERTFLLRNSWGANWGDQGYGVLPESYLLEHCELCYYSKTRIPTELLPALQGVSLKLTR